MIIFDLDTLADDSHRRHFIDPFCWEGEWKSYNDACGDDDPILPSITVIRSMYGLDYYANHEDVHIWTTRCESTRGNTEKWLDKYRVCAKSIKMRPIGDKTPWHELKEKWVDELIQKSIVKVMIQEKENHNGINEIDFVFDSDKESIEMWKRRGVFVFNCNQG